MVHLPQCNCLRRLWLFMISVKLEIVIWKVTFLSQNTTTYHCFLFETRFNLILSSCIFFCIFFYLSQPSQDIRYPSPERFIPEKKIIKNLCISLPVQRPRTPLAIWSWYGCNEHLQEIWWTQASCGCRRHLPKVVEAVTHLLGGAVGAGHCGAGALATSSSLGWWRLASSTFTTSNPQPMWRITLCCSDRHTNSLATIIIQ